MSFYPLFKNWGVIFTAKINQGALRFRLIFLTLKTCSKARDKKQWRNDVCVTRHCFPSAQTAKWAASVRIAGHHAPLLKFLWINNNSRFISFRAVATRRRCCRGGTTKITFENGINQHLRVQLISLHPFETSRLHTLLTWNLHGRFYFNHGNQCNQIMGL